MLTFGSRFIVVVLGAAALDEIVQLAEVVVVDGVVQSVDQLLALGVQLVAGVEVRLVPDRAGALPHHLGDTLFESVTLGVLAFEIRFVLEELRGFLLVIHLLMRPVGVRQDGETLESLQPKLMLGLHGLLLPFYLSNT